MTFFSIYKKFEKKLFNAIWSTLLDTLYTDYIPFKNSILLREKFSHKTKKQKIPSQTLSPYLSRSSRGRGFRGFFLLRSLFPPRLSSASRSLPRSLSSSTPSAATPLYHVGTGILPGRRAQPLGRLLRRRAEGTACRRGEKQVSPVSEPLVLVIGHRGEVAELPAASYRCARSDRRLAGAAHHAEPSPRVPQGGRPVNGAEDRAALQSASSSSSTTTESLLAEVLAEHKIHDWLSVRQRERERGGGSVWRTRESYRRTRLLLGLSFRPIFHFLFVLIDQHAFSFSLNRVFSFCYFFFFFRCKVMIRFDDGFKPESGLFGRVFFFYNEWKKQRRWWWWRCSTITKASLGSFPTLVSSFLQSHIAILSFRR